MDDGGILRLFRDGDPAAPRILYEKYSALLYAVCLRYVSEEMEAEDVLQESFMTIFEKIGTFETSVLPFEDCCTIFVAKHPVTKPHLNVIQKSETHLRDCIDAMMEKAIAEDEVIWCS